MSRTHDRLTLSRQERRVISLSMEGLGDKEVATQMGLAIGTVRTYWKRIATKTGGNTRAEIVSGYARLDSHQELERERALVAQLRDEIAERRRAEERFRAICACSPLGIYVSDSEGVCQYVNPAWERITGLPGQSALGTDWLRIIHADDADRLLDWWRNSVTRGETRPIEFRFVTLDGIVHVRTICALMLLDGRIEGYVGTIEALGVEG